MRRKSLIRMSNSRRISDFICLSNWKVIQNLDCKQVFPLMKMDTCYFCLSLTNGHRSLINYSVLQKGYTHTHAHIYFLLLAPSYDAVRTLPVQRFTLLVQLFQSRDTFIFFPFVLMRRHTSIVENIQIYIINMKCLCIFLNFKIHPAGQIDPSSGPVLAHEPYV